MVRVARCVSVGAASRWRVGRWCRGRRFPGSSPLPTRRLRPGVGEHLSAHAYVEVVPDHNDRDFQVAVRGGDQGGVVRLGHGSFSLGCQAAEPTSSFVPCVASSSQSSSQAFPLGRIEARALVASGLPGVLSLVNRLRADPRLLGGLPGVRILREHLRSLNRSCSRRDGRAVSQPMICVLY
jgi:hypothetical protein